MRTIKEQIFIVKMVRTELSYTLRPIPVTPFAARTADTGCASLALGIGLLASHGKPPPFHSFWIGAAGVFGSGIGGRICAYGGRAVGNGGGEQPAVYILF
jgi:hypothetical protein